MTEIRRWRVKALALYGKILKIFIIGESHPSWFVSRAANPTSRMISVKGKSLLFAVGAAVGIQQTHLRRRLFISKSCSASTSKIPHNFAKLKRVFCSCFGGVFLVKDDPCFMYRSDKGMGVWSLWPFYSPLSATNGFVLLSFTPAFGPTGSSAQIFVDKAWWDWEIMPALTPVENTELLERSLCKYILFPQKRTAVLMTNWVKSHLAWSK